MDEVSFRIDSGDKIGLVGRNGAGKTTLTRVLAGEGLPAGGKVIRTGEIGYLPQDPRTPDMEQLAKDRILSARDLDKVITKLRKAENDMASEDDSVRDKAMRRYDRLEVEFLANGGYAAEAEAAAISSNLALPERILNQPLKTLSGGQRRRVELARILFSGAQTMLLDEPTNHLDADSIAWLREFLKNHNGGLIVISHDTELLEATVNKVFHLDANRATIDQYNLGWKKYLAQRETDERARRRERANAEKKAGVLMDQANKMRAKATKAVAAQNMAKRAERLLAGLEEVRAQDKVAALRFPNPSPCGKTPLTAEGLSKSYGSLEIFTDVVLDGQVEALHRHRLLEFLVAEQRVVDFDVVDFDVVCVDVVCVMIVDSDSVDHGIVFDLFAVVVIGVVDCVIVDGVLVERGVFIAVVEGQ